MAKKAAAARNGASKKEELKEELTELLVASGMNEAEIAVYVAGLELGSRSAALIAKRAQLKRGHTYNVLSSLIIRGLVQEFIKDGVRHFTMSSPVALLGMLESALEDTARRRDKLTTILPLLEQLQPQHSKQPKVRFFQGAEGIKEIFEDTLRIKEGPILGIGDLSKVCPPEASLEIHEWNLAYVARRASMGIWYHGLVTNSVGKERGTKIQRKEKRHLKILGDLEIPIELVIYGSKIGIMSTAYDHYGVIIDDELISSSLRNFHHAVWRLIPS